MFIFFLNIKSQITGCDPTVGHYMVWKSLKDGIIKNMVLFWTLRIYLCDVQVFLFYAVIVTVTIGSISRAAATQ